MTTATATPDRRRRRPVTAFGLSLLLHGGLLCLAIYSVDSMTASRNAHHKTVAEEFSVLLAPAAAQHAAPDEATEPELIQSNLPLAPETPAEKPDIVVAKKRVMAASPKKAFKKTDPKHPEKAPAKTAPVHPPSATEKDGESEVTRQGANTRSQGTDRALSSDSGPQGTAAQDERAVNRGEAISYLAKVRFEVEKNKVYPRRAKQMRIEGIAGVEIQLDEQGNIVVARLISGAGDAVLDDAAMEAVQRAKSSGPPPPGMGRVLTLQVEFSLRRR